MAALCLQRCEGCADCRHLSVSPSLAECRWSETCDMGALHPMLGFDRFRSAPYAARHHGRIRRPVAAVTTATAPPSTAAHAHARATPRGHAPSSSDATEGGQPPPQLHRYAFFASVHRAPCAVRQLVISVRAVYGREPPFYLHTDNLARGGLNYTRLCAALGCEWTFSREAAGNPKHYRHGYEADLALGLTYLQRLIARMATCACEFLVTLEDDVCVRRPAVPPPQAGDVGGLPGPSFSEAFLRHVENVSRRAVARPSHWGCAGACYYRTAAFLSIASSLTPAVVAEAFAHDAWAVGYMDAVGPALGLLRGLRVVPWSAVGQTNMDGIGLMARFPLEERAFDHKCDATRARARDHGECGGGRGAEHGAEALWEESRR